MIANTPTFISQKQSHDRNLTKQNLFFFPKESYNILLKVGVHEYIYIAESPLKKPFHSKVAAKTFCHIHLEWNWGSRWLIFRQLKKKKKKKNEYNNIQLLTNIQAMMTNIQAIKNKNKKQKRI